MSSPVKPAGGFPHFLPPDLRQQPEELTRSQRQHAEHQGRHDFGMTSDPEMPPTEAIL